VSFQKAVYTMDPLFQKLQKMHFICKSKTVILWERLAVQ